MHLKYDLDDEHLGVANPSWYTTDRPPAHIVQDALQRYCHPHATAVQKSILTLDPALRTA